MDFALVFLLRKLCFKSAVNGHQFFAFAADGNPAAEALTCSLYSHSMVPGGLLVMSSATRFTPGTSLMMRVLMRSSRS